MAKKPVTMKKVDNGFHLEKTSDNPERTAKEALNVLLDATGRVDLKLRDGLLPYKELTSKE